eukprot:g20066.t1
MIGAEDVIPYQRPPLSKKYLLGEMSFERLTFRPHAWFAENDVELRLATYVEEIDRQAKTVRTQDGSTLDYELLVLATGASPRTLPAAIGGDLDGVYTVRDKRDADRLAGEMKAGRRLLIIGGGYIGLEAAAVARHLGLEVTLIEMADRILSRVASSETADVIRDLHLSHGVAIREKTGLNRLIGRNGRVTAAELSDGTVIDVDAAIVGIGVTPNDRLAQDCGLDVGNGVIVDEFTRTSDPAVFAVGDCALLPWQGGRIRLESVQNAVDQAESVAAHLAGGAEPYDARPWFWSDQYDVKLQIAGFNLGYDETIVRPGARQGSVSIWYFRDGRLIAVDAINDAKAYAAREASHEGNGMPAPKNHFKAALQAGKPQIGLWLNTGEPLPAEIAATAGFDWLVIDGEHGPNDLRSIIDQLRAIATGRSEPAVRPPSGEAWFLKQLLDAGARTLLVPMVDSAEQAQALVHAVRYPPRGIRGLGAAVARASSFNAIADYAQTADEEICLLVQAETLTAINNIEAIAAVDGVDGIFIGPADLSADMGYLGRFEAPEAADAIVAAEPEPMEYVRVCDAFGTGYFYIPGTETCLKVGGRVRFDAKYGDAYAADSEGTYTNTRAEIYLNSASDTEWGALKTNIVARFDYNPRNDVDLGVGGRFADATRTRLIAANIQLGGFLVGLADSYYSSFINYAGDVINDDVISYGPFELNQVAYVFDGGNGFGAYVAVEDDGVNEDDFIGDGASDWLDITAGVKFDNGTFMAGLVGGYDESAEEGAIKARVGGNFGGFTAWVMGGWNTDGDTSNKYAPGDSEGISWGDWAVWGGVGYKFTDKVAANLQLAYTDNETFAATANVKWTPVSGLLIQPEISYTSWDAIDEDQFAGMAADAIVAAEPEPMEYVRVCDAFGTGYFYIPGTETCLKIGGRVRFDAMYGDAYVADSEGTYTNTRAEIYLDTASDTEWGALKTNIVARFDYNPRNDVDLGVGGDFADATRTRLIAANIQLGGFLVGLADSYYSSFINYAGDVINDDVISYGQFELNQVAYVFDGGNGFGAYVAVEDDGENEDDFIGDGASDWLDITAGVKFDNGTFMAGLVGGYDESAEEGAIKARVGGTFGGFTAWIMGGWNTDGDTSNKYAPGDTYVGWGDWAAWGGVGYKFSDKVAANLQLAYTDNETFAATGNVQWTPVSGLLIQPEVSYTSWDNAVIDEDQWAGMAADAIVAAEPEPMEYVRVCDAFGTGYFYIPGSETCLKVGGRVRFDASYGDSYALDSDGTYTNTRAEIYLSSASDTEWGALKTNITARFDYNPRNDADLGVGGNFADATRTRLMVATIELAGFTAGLQDSLYESFINYAGNVANDDVVNYGPSEVPMFAYTYKGGNGFSAFVAVEDDGTNEDDFVGDAASDWPNVTAGVKFDNGTFLAGITAGYDESADEGAIKARVGGKFGAFSAFVMGGWNTDGDTTNSYAPGSRYGTGTTIGWGDWALWAGAGYKFTDKVAANAQVAYTDSDILAATANVQWTPVSGFLIQPEVSYTSIDNAVADEDQWQGMVRIQRTF